MKKLNVIVISSIIVTLFFFQATLLKLYIHPIWKKNYYVERNLNAVGLEPHHILLAISGFSELIASLLWVKADTYFHEGNYDAVLPLLRIATYLDPHNVDLYTVSMWHMAYNFTDSYHHSDKRYIPLSIALGKECIAKNKQSGDAYFELGWLWFHKIDDFHENSSHWFSKALQQKDLISGKKNMYAHALVKQNSIDRAVEYFDDVLKSNNESKKHNEVVKHNLDTLLLRNAYRSMKKDKNEKIKPNLSGTIEVTGKNKITITGHCDTGLPTDRIKILFRDADYHPDVKGGINWDSYDKFYIEPDYNVTLFVNSFYIKNGKFKATINMNDDPTIYPLLSDKYILEVFYNPSSSDNFQQDFIGNTGELLEDKYLRNDIRTGSAVLYKHFVITKEMLSNKTTFHF